jgi:hypothetical protein
MNYNNYNYLLLLLLGIGIVYYNSATKLEGFSLPGVSLPSVSLPTSIRPLVRRARLFRENSVRQLEKMTIRSNAKAMIQ